MFHVPAHKQQDQSKTPAQVPATPLPVEKKSAWWHVIGHFYRPLHTYRGQVLKYAGIATVGNFQQAVQEWNEPRGIYDAGFVLAQEHIADRIVAISRKPFNG